MIIIPVDEMTWPQPTAIKIACNGENYTVYEEGDELPPEPVNE
jgi:hypothetical protein